MLAFFLKKGGKLAIPPRSSSAVAEALAWNTVGSWGSTVKLKAKESEQSVSLSLLFYPVPHAVYFFCGVCTWGVVFKTRSLQCLLYVFLSTAILDYEEFCYGQELTWIFKEITGDRFCASSYLTFGHYVSSIVTKVQLCIFDQPFSHSCSALLCHLGTGLIREQYQTA